MALGPIDITTKKWQELEERLTPHNKILAETIENIIDEVLARKFLGDSTSYITGKIDGQIAKLSIQVSIGSFPTDGDVEAYIVCLYLSKGWRSVRFTAPPKGSVTLMS